MSLSMIGDIAIYTKNCRVLNNDFTYAGKDTQRHLY